MVDSEDIPLNLSREILQNGALIAKLKHVLTSKVIKWLDDQSKNDDDKYNQFFRKFGMFIKEGIYTDFNYKV